MNVEVSFKFEVALDAVNITIGDSKGMDVVSARSLSLAQQQNGQGHMMTISVVPWEAGLHFVNVFADTESAGRRLRRTFAIPVEVPGVLAQQKNRPDRQIMPDGEG